MKKMTKNEWIAVLVDEIENRFNPSEVDGFESSAPAIKLAILSDLFDEETEKIEKSKRKAYDELADLYSAASAWN